MKKLLAIGLFASFFGAKAQDIEPTLTEACVIVSVSDTKKKPKEGEVVSFEDPKTKKVYQGVTKADGKFKVLLPKNVTYTIKYLSFGDDVEYSSVPIPEAKDTKLTFNVNIEFEMPTTYTLNHVFFDSGKSTLRPDSYTELNKLAKFMANKKTVNVEIGGHTDNVGVKEANQKLSEERANAVRNYLIKKGIAAERVTAKGYGDSRPVASNDSESGKQKNRRTEVNITKQ